MKDSLVISITKHFNLTDVNIKEIEICWSKVKMTSTRWIACCHRRLVQHTPPPSAYQPASNHHSMSADRRQSPSFARPLASHHRANNHHPHQQHAGNHNHYSSSQSKSPLSNGLISSSYQTPPQRHRLNGLPSSVSSSNTPQTPPNSSPLSASSLLELGRKSSSSSSTSSTNSYTVTNDRFCSPSSMKHSKSTMDLASSLKIAQAHHQLRHHQHYRPKDDSALCLAVPVPVIENTITILSPMDGLLINCQTNWDSNCAQISPVLNVIAVSNDYWIAFYSIKTNECLGTLQFPARCRYWTWIRADTVAVVTDKEVYHWSLTGIDAHSNYVQTGDLRLIFSVDSEIRDHQIVDYSVDPLFSNWCALNTLYVDEDGEIGGRVQIFSHSYNQSQCIEAHASAFTSYQFDYNHHSSTLLVAVRRHARDRTWKLHIIELGPIPSGNHSHKSINQLLCSHNKRIGPVAGDGTQTEDIPTHVVCDSKIGLIYLLSKYGSFYICDLETGVPLYYDLLVGITEGSALFSFAYDATSDSLVAISRNGQVLSIQVSLSALVIESDHAKVSNKVLERIRLRLKELKGIDVDSALESAAQNNHSPYLSVNSYDSAHSSRSSTSSASLPPKPRTYLYGEKTPSNDSDSLSSFYQSQSDKSASTSQNNYRTEAGPPPEPIFDARDEQEEQITRL